ncbi:tRNA N6-adenosine threonylcarbamoyltransferase, mitochondrial isoform X3 [Mixophyes fleayi]|uniref:tRNA N6-adenosine threonylcarbamoyltransferase, mitochondrial isoform X3 n=1 Tax=Mixophyes fleayi TaxID=3061075 RepID=UPI003F4E4236
MSGLPQLKMARLFYSMYKTSLTIGKERVFLHDMVKCSRVVLGIETSCDDTGAAVVDENGKILGESLISQKEVHLKTGGIIPTMAQQLHRDNIDRVVNAAIISSGLSFSDLSAIATTLKPGLALSLEVARRLSLMKHPECSSMSGGQGIEHLAQYGDKMLFSKLSVPMSQHRDCNFSFAGLRNHFDQLIRKLEEKEGIQNGELLSRAADIAASFQHSVAHHIVKRTQRAILFCKQESLLPTTNASLVVSGGVASNGYVRKMLQHLTDDMDMSVLCPPPQLCTDNGVMVAWNGIERLCVGAGVLDNTYGIRYEPRALLGTDISEQVRNAAIKLPSLKKKD